ncbi:MAG: hypothetical protein ABH834_02280 [Candidatus Altiarchaeota archaeon]
MHPKGQFALEWLISHTWAIITVLAVGIALSYAGVFDVGARPRFEGLVSSGVQPIPDEVRMYSDGILIFTVVNTKPYNINVEWVEVSPLANREDTIRTNVNTTLEQGDIAVFQLDASNIYSTAAASVLLPSPVSADNLFINFYLCLREQYWGGAWVGKTHCAEVKNIPVFPVPLAPVCPEICCTNVDVYGHMCPDPWNPLPDCYECWTFDDVEPFNPWNACVDLCIEFAEGECEGPYPGHCSGGEEPPEPEPDTTTVEPETTTIESPP